VVTHRLHMRDIGYMKPKGYEKHVTLTELSRLVDRDISWLRKLEAENRIPRAKRVEHGQLKVRLWSPNQVKEIREILSRMRPGRPSK
jgi:hypothetical protein